MPTNEQTIEIDQHRSSKLQPKNLDRTPKPSKFIFDAALLNRGRRQRPTGFQNAET